MGHPVYVTRIQWLQRNNDSMASRPWMVKTSIMPSFKSSSIVSDKGRILYGEHYMVVLDWFPFQEPRMNWVISMSYAFYIDEGTRLPNPTVVTCVLSKNTLVLPTKGGTSPSITISAVAGTFKSMSHTLLTLLVRALMLPPYPTRKPRLRNPCAAMTLRGLGL